MKPFDEELVAGVNLGLAGIGIEAKRVEGLCGEGRHPALGFRRTAVTEKFERVAQVETGLPGSAALRLAHRPGWPVPCYIVDLKLGDFAI